MERAAPSARLGVQIEELVGDELAARSPVDARSVVSRCDGRERGRVHSNAAVFTQQSADLQHLRGGFVQDRQQLACGRWRWRTIMTTSAFRNSRSEERCGRPSPRRSAGLHGQTIDQPKE
jgi:hypothetical protein